MKAFFLPLSFMCMLTVAKAQESATKEAPASNYLLQQFNHLKNKSNTYQGHKVIEIGKLDAFWKNVEGTIKATEKKLTQAQNNADKDLLEARAKVTEQQTLIDSLKQANALKEQEVQQSIHQIANLSVLGVDMEKQNYVYLTFGMIASLVLTLGVVLFSYKRNKKYSLEKQQALEEMEQEYAEYKKNAWDKEVKLKRELQTELNRAEEMQQQLAAYKRHEPVYKAS